MHQVFLSVFENINFGHCIASWGVDAVVVWQDQRFPDAGLSSLLCILAGVLSGSWAACSPSCAWRMPANSDNTKHECVDCLMCRCW